MGCPAPRSGVGEQSGLTVGSGLGRIRRRNVMLIDMAHARARSPLADHKTTETDSSDQGGRSRFWNWATKTFAWWLLLIPAVVFALVKYLSWEDLWIFRESSEVKQLFEVVLVQLLSVQKMPPVLDAIEGHCQSHRVADAEQAVGVVFQCTPKAAK